MSTRRGVLVLVLVAVLLGVLVLIVALNLRRPAVARGSEPRVLVFRAPDELAEGPPPARGFPWGGRRPRLTLFDVVDGIRRAADDDRVVALVLHVDGISWGWAQVGEVREALAGFRAAGKPVYASLVTGGDREYLLASAADRVSMAPEGALMLDGLTANAVFFRGTFDKLDVKPNFAHVGRFKSAVEPYTRTGLSDDARTALSAVLDDLYGLLVDSLAVSRGVPRDSVLRLIDGGPYTAQEALGNGLLDTLLYDTEVDSLAMRKGRSRRLSRDFTDYALASHAPSATGAHIALVGASGEIVQGRSRSTMGQDAVLGSETLVEALRQARTRRAVKAIVLRVDSPGGDAFASDDIWREVERCRAVKPVIVSMSDLAASGGYYIAVAGDSLVASPATLTGSIGILGGKLNVLGLYHKLGLNVETLSRGRHADMLSPYRDFTPEEEERFQAGLESFYRGFVGRVAKGRRMDEARVDSLAQGRVWTGRAAVGLGLVDRLGGIETAIAMARAKAGIGAGEELVIDRYPRVKRPFFEGLLEELFSDDDTREAVAALPPALRVWATIARYATGAPLALMPYTVEVR